MVRTKVFVGNLSFATKENELAKEFEASGKVISANIITRGPRSLGYGFVEMDSEQDAENAVKLLNKKEIDGRPINVEVAKAREEGSSDDQQRTGSNSRGRGGSRGGSRGGNRGGDRGGDRGGFGGGFRRRFRRRDGSDDEGENGGEQDQQRGERGGDRGGERRRGGDRGGFRGGRGRGGRGGSRGGFTGKSNRDEKRDDQRAPSTTLLFVANLPFSLDNDSFAKLFKDANLAFKTCHVVKKRSGRSKGFGFVEFENETDQQKALTAMNNKQVEGRELVVKVALTENKSDDNNNTKTSTTATTTASPTTTSTTTPTTTTTTEKKEEEKKTTTPSTTTTTTEATKPSTPKTEQKK